MERDIVKPPSVGTGERRVPFVKGAGVFFPPQHFPGSVSNSLSEQRQDISHRNTTGACRAKDQCSGAWAGTEGRTEGRGGKNGGRARAIAKVREGRRRKRKCGVGRKVRKREDEGAEYVCGRGRKTVGVLEGVECVALPQGSVCKPLSTPQSCFHKEIYKTGLRCALLPCIMSE